MNSTFFQSLPFGIIALVLVGSSWCLTGLVMGNAPKHGVLPSHTLRVGSLLSILIGFLIMGISKQSSQAPDWAFALIILLYFISGILNNIMCDLMSQAMQLGPNGIVWGIIQSGTVGPFLSGILFFGVTPSLIRILGLVLLLSAMVCFSLGKNNNTQAAPREIRPLYLFKHKCSWKLLSLICFAIVAVQQSLTTIPSYYEECRHITPIFRSIIMATGGLSGIIGWSWIRHVPSPIFIPKEILKKPIFWIYVLSLQFFGLLLSYTCFYPGMDILAKSGRGGMAYPLMVGSCIVSFTLASIFLLKEKIRPLQIFSLILCITGLICLCQ